MSYCRRCGFKLPDDALFCPSCGAPVYKSRLELASWGERIVAYLIDVIILGIIVAPIISMFLWCLIWDFRIGWSLFTSLSFNNMISFLYWTFLEGVYGQSLGKMILKLKVVRTDGQSINMLTAAIESLGKAFLLPIDFILGLILYPQKQQRLFNYISNTIVIKLS